MDLSDIERFFNENFFKKIPSSERQRQRQRQRGGGEAGIKRITKKTKQLNVADCPSRFAVPKEDKEFMHGVPESGYEPNYNHRQQFLTTTTTTTTTTTPRPPSPPSPPLPRQYPAQVINIHGCTQFDKKKRERLTSRSPFAFSPMPQGTQILSSGILPTLLSCRPRSLVKWRKKTTFLKKCFKKDCCYICFFFPVELGPPKGTLASILSLKGGSPQAERLRWFQRALGFFTNSFKWLFPLHRPKAPPRRNSPPRVANLSNHRLSKPPPKV